MRIIGGNLKGRKLSVPKSMSFRPTADRVREAIFSSIESMRSLDGLVVLDLFAGSGALGIEALSRGASCCHFVEKDRRASKRIIELLGELGLAACTRVTCGDVSAVFSRDTLAERDCAKGFSESYDLVFADPPYGAWSGEQVVELLSNSSVISPGSLLVFEGDQGINIDDINQRSLALSPVLKKDRNYGGTVLSYFVFE